MPPCSGRPTPAHSPQRWPQGRPALRGDQGRQLTLAVSSASYIGLGLTTATQGSEVAPTSFPSGHPHEWLPLSGAGPEALERRGAGVRTEQLTPQAAVVLESSGWPVDKSLYKGRQRPWTQRQSTLVHTPVRSGAGGRALRDTRDTPSGGGTSRVFALNRTNAYCYADSSMESTISFLHIPKLGAIVLNGVPRPSSQPPHEPEDFLT